MHRLPEHLDDARWARSDCGRRRKRDEAAEHDQQDDLGDGAVGAGEKDGDHDDRPELSGDPGAEHGAPERCRRQARVGEDRHERSERCRRERDPEQPALRVQAGCSSKSPTASPIESEIAQPAVPSATERRGTCFSITSRPAKKKRKTRPMLARNSI